MTNSRVDPQMFVGRDPADIEQLREGMNNLEPLLNELSLGVSQIDEQNLGTLQDSLRRIDRFIDNPSALRTGPRVVLSSSSRQVDNFGLATLLNRKSYILERISSLSTEQDRAELKQVVAGVVPDPGSADKLFQLVDEKVGQRLKEALAIQTEVQETDEAQRKAMLFAVELKERKSAIARSWFERESVASIVGGILLLGLGIAIVVAMFTDTATTEVITSAFLLILGYFFGQATFKKSGGSDSGGE